MESQKIVFGDASLCRASVMLVIKFYESGKVLPSNFLEISFFKHIETTASEITKKQSVIFNIVGTPGPLIKGSGVGPSKNWVTWEG